MIVGTIGVFSESKLGTRIICVDGVFNSRKKREELAEPLTNPAVFFVCTVP
jgi:hypothetical protein